jgi:hypothetical protein
MIIMPFIEMLRRRAAQHDMNEKVDLESTKGI